MIKIYTWNSRGEKEKLNLKRIQKAEDAAHWPNSCLACVTHTWGKKRKEVIHKTKKLEIQVEQKEINIDKVWLKAEINWRNQQKVV
jgi:hypothetical protein